MDNKFAMVAKTFKGLEDVLRDELIALGAENVELGNRMVSFEGDLEMMYKANFCCRTALRILKPIIKFTADNTDELYDAVRDIDWEQYLSLESTFAIDSTVNSDEFTHSKFVTYRVKDGIVDHFTDKYGKRPSIRVAGADVLFNVHISDNRVTISLDSSGAPLNQRGYRVETGGAPINEVLAAGIILKTGWRGDTDFIDPMCGSGTFLIEAALIATNTNPGVYRSGYAFERWPDFDRDLFEKIFNDDSAEREFNHRIYGGDIDPETVAIARKNIREAHLEGVIDLVCKDFRDWDNPPADGILVTNPPYGERLRPENMSELYHDIGATLKKYFSGYHAWIIGYREEHFAEIGLKPSVKLPLLNGSLECSLNEYVLFEGKYSDFRAAGGSVSNSEFNREARPKVRHLSDEEWSRDAARYDGEERRRRKEFKRDFKRDDRKRDFKRDDRRRDFRRDDDRKRDFKRDDRRRDDRRRDDRRQYRQTPAKTVTPKGPRLPEESQIDLAGGRIMRSRRGWGRPRNEANDAVTEKSED